MLWNKKVISIFVNIKTADPAEKTINETPLWDGD